ncbi:MAG: ATP-binding protein [Candidatus Magasanikbacteria bacterium]|nr:ATP-binding protein [Candidatus Magasanikbacteria bacterium]
MLINRLAKKLLHSKIQEGKVVLLYGPRRTGKTTLLEDFLKSYPRQSEIKFVNGETRVIQDALSQQSVESFKRFVGNARVVCIDEAQKIPNIGLNLKLIVDSMPQVTVIASGSASFSLAQEVGEPLTGRKKTIHLFPVSAAEIIATRDEIFFKENLEHLLVYGSYPELFQIKGSEKQQEYLRELADAYLFKDILEMGGIRNAKKLRDVLTLLAFQIGNEVSLSELANNLDMHKNTVYHYLDLLEKTFVIVNVRGFSRNLRKEVTKTSRYYFYDNGVRNALINNFNPLSLRDDIGMLWENYLIMERLKKQSYSELLSNNYFWRTYDQKEIDWVEERGGRLFGYEFKWGKKSNKPPNDWIKNYPSAEYMVINKTNYLEFIV